MSEFAHAEPRSGVLALSGELTVAHAQELHALFVRFLAAHAALEIDLLNVTKLDTAGVQLLLMLHREANSANKPLHFLGHSLAVEEVLELLGLTDVLGQPAAVVWS